MPTMIDVKKRVVKSAMASWGRNLSASAMIIMLTMMLKSPRVSQIKGREMNRRIGFRKVLSRVKTTAATAKETQLPFKTKPDKNTWAA